MTHLLDGSKILKDGIVYTFEQDDIYEGELVFVYVNDETNTGFYLFASEIEERTELKFIHPNPYGCRDILIPLTDYFTTEQLELFKEGKVSAEPSFPVLKVMEDTVSITKPDYGVRKATDEEVINFFKGKEKLYAFDKEQTIHEVDYNSPVSLLAQLVEQNKAYVIKPF